MTDPLPVAIEARESAKSAHHRLDRMNGSIDRLGAAVESVDAKVGAVLLRLERADGAAQARRGFVLSRRFIISTVAVLLTSSVASTIVVLLLRRHP